jgi:homoserine O-acetyltransferase
MTRSGAARRALSLVTAILLACAAEAGAQTPPDILLSPQDARWNEPAPEVFRAAFETTRGRFVIDVQRAWSPHGADRFYNLVRHGFYDGIRFNRVIAGFIAQWGVSGYPEVTRIWKTRAIPDDPVRQSNVRGTITFAMTGPDTRTTQIYISLADNSRLDAQGFSPFGRVAEGMDVVDQLYSGYGENAGGGVRAGNQGPIEEGGNAWLDREFPLLDHIIRARIVTPGPRDGA